MQLSHFLILISQKQPLMAERAWPFDFRCTAKSHPSFSGVA